MIFKLIDLFFQIYLILLFVRILGSWFPNFREHKLMLFVSFYTDPYLNLFRKLIPPFGMVDISPILAIFCLGYIEKFVKILTLTILS